MTALQIPMRNNPAPAFEPIDAALGGFAPDLEAAWETHYYERVRVGLRIVAGLLALLSFAYAGRDLLDTHSLFLTARVNGTPAVFYAVLFGLTYWPGFKRVWMPVTALGGAAVAVFSLAGLALYIAASTANGIPREAGFLAGRNLFFTLQTCILMICFAALRLPFRWAFVLQMSVLGAGMGAFAFYLAPNKAAHVAEMRFLQPTLLVLFVVLLAAFVQEKLARSVFLATHRLGVHAREMEQANTQLQNDLDAAARIQRALLPANLPDSPRVRFAYLFQPCQTLGGDILNVFALDDTHIGFYLLDVTGHGVGASLLSVAVSHFLMPGTASVVMETTESGYVRIAAPCDVITRLNAHFSIENTGLFFTIFYGVLNTQTGDLRYANAGHPQPLILSGDHTPDWLQGGGLPAGVLADAEYTACAVRLAPGDRFYLYSDGITEARDPAREEFGDERLVSHLSSLAECAIDDCPHCFYERLRAWIGPHAATDDISLLAFEMR